MKKCYLFAILLLICGAIYADELEDHPDTLGGSLLNIDADRLFVSLGSHCEAAVALNENDLRIRAFPFDWLLSSSHEQFISLIDNDFLFLTNEDYLIQNPVYPHVIENNYYEIEFRHDWPFSDLVTTPLRYREQLDALQKKYQRRIERFRQLRECSKKVFFVRAAFEYLNEPNPYWRREGIEMITAAQAQELREALDRYFPGLDFTLVIVNYREENAPVISGIDGVIEFKIRKSDKQVDYANLAINLLQR